MRIGLYVSTGGGTPLGEVVQGFAAAEKAGLASAWVGQVLDRYDALTLLAVAAGATRRIELGSWVVPFPNRHPAALAQQALTAQAASDGRVLLGVGVSHAPVIEKRMGIPFRAPAAHAREYLGVLRGLLAGEFVEHDGERLHVRMALETGGTPPPPIFLGALGPLMLGVAGELADGVALWLGGLRFVEEFALPRIAEAARRAGRPMPRVACGLPIAVCRDRERGRASAETFLAKSAALPAYQRVLDRGGAGSPGAVAVVGDEGTVRAELARLAGIGVTDFTAVLIPVEGDPDAAARTLDLLADVAKG